MRYLPHTSKDITAMLEVIGAKDIEDLFISIPTECRRKEPLNLPPAKSEWELDRYMDCLAADTATNPEHKIFLGAGSYDHYIPEVVKQLLRRGEIFTAYTPYQPEVSQGTLQGIYEYQTLITRMLNMEVANASMYDGASALAEALLMAIRSTRRKKIAISGAIHPHYRQVVATYFEPTGYEIILLPFGSNGRTELDKLNDCSQLAAVAVQSPNFFGCLEDLEKVNRVVRQDPKTLMVTAFSEPLAFGLYKPPGSFDADIVCGEGQGLGNARCFGGPGLGIFATKKKYMRTMPGRLVGKTVDKEGRRGFVLTLSTREQHIRREKATSNICSNQGLCATAAAMYMACLGASGFAKLARLNFDKAEYLKAALKNIGAEIPFSTPTFNEFVIKFPGDSQAVYKSLLERKILAGLPLEPYYPELAGHYLVCVTETADKQDLDLLVKEVQS